MAQRTRLERIALDRAAVAKALFARLDRACIVQPRRDLAFDPPLKRIARLEATVPVFMALAREAIRQANADRMSAQLERAKQVAVNDAGRKGDRGTLVRRQRGDLVQEDRPDIDSDAEYKPTIRGARRRDPLRDFLGIKSVSKPHDGAQHDDARRWIAAQSYRALIEIAGGAKIGVRPLERVDAPTSASQYSDRMLDAITATRRVRETLGSDYPVIRWTVEEYGGVDEFAMVANLAIEAAMAKLTAGLDALVDHLGGYQAGFGEA